MFRAVLSLLLAGAFSAAAQPANPTVADAREFMDKAEARLLALSIEAGRAGWVQATYITEDTEALAALASERAINATVELAKQSRRFDGLDLPGELVFNPDSLAGSRRQVADKDFQPGFIGQLLQLGIPQTHAGAVTSAGIGSD